MLAVVRSSLTPSAPLPASVATSPAARKRMSRISNGTATSSPYVGQRNSLAASVDERRRSRPQSTAEYPRPPPSAGGRGNRSSVLTNRSSATSDSSTPSFAFSSGGASSTGQPVTPPPLSASSSYGALKSLPPKGSANVNRHSTGNQRSSIHHDHRRMSSLAARYEAPLPSVPIHEIEPTSESECGSAGHVPSPSVVTFREPVVPARSAYDSDKDVARPRSSVGRQATSSGGESGSESDSKFLSTFSVYVEAGEGFDYSDDAEDEDEQGETLYVAEAMCDAPTTKSLNYRSGFPVISFKVSLLDRFARKARGADRFFTLSRRWVIALT